MLAVAFLLLGQQTTDLPPRALEKGVTFFREVESPTEKGIPDLYLNDNAYTQINKVYLLISDTNDLPADKDGDKNRDEINVEQLYKESFSQSPRSNQVNQPPFPDRLFTYVQPVNGLQSWKTRSMGQSKLGGRIIKKDERELVFICITEMAKHEKRTLNHIVYSRTYLLRTLSIETFYTSPGRWINPYAAVGKATPISKEAEPKWPRKTAAEIAEVFEIFNGPQWWK